jgi:hypothetical protein
MAVATYQVIRAFLTALGLPEDVTFIRIPVGIKGPIEVLYSRDHLNTHTPGNAHLCHLVRWDDMAARPIAQTGMDLGGALQQALGLPPETTYIGIEVDLQRDGVATVNAYYYPTLEALQRCEEVLRPYRVAELGETTVQGEKR